jgi:hypothetical protein
MVLFVARNFAAVDGWQRLDVPESQEYLLIYEEAKVENFAGHELTTVTLLINLSHISNYCFIACALNTYKNKDAVIQLHFKADQIPPLDLQLKLASALNGLKELFRAFSETTEFLIEDQYLVLREIADDYYLLSGEEGQLESSSSEEGSSEVW